MPPKDIISSDTHNRSSKEETSQQLSILLQKVIGSDTAPNFTEEQTNEILSQRRKITEYVHEDRKRESYDSKFYLVSIALFVLLFSALVLNYYPEVFPEVLSLVVGLFGGYAIGKGRNN